MQTKSAPASLSRRARPLGGERMRGRSGVGSAVGGWVKSRQVRKQIYEEGSNHESKDGNMLVHFVIQVQDVS